MAVRSLTWVARRASERGLCEARDLAAALGMDVLADSTALVVVQTQRGDVLEFCGPAYPVPDHLFASGETVIGFDVDDLDAATAALEERGMLPLAAAGEAPGVRFRHFSGPGGAVYGLIEKNAQP